MQQGHDQSGIRETTKKRKYLICIPGLKAWPLLRIRCSMASRLNLIPPFLSDNLDGSR